MSPLMAARLGFSCTALVLAASGALYDWPDWAREMNIAAAVASLFFSLATSPTVRRWQEAAREGRPTPRAPSWPHH